jgi:hypothetical protein
MDKQAIATITQARDVLWRIADNPSMPDAVRNEAGAACAALRNALPKPRFYATERYVYDVQTGLIHAVPDDAIPDDATAHLIARDTAASYNKRLGEVE